jgi:hypothetical protein
MLPIDWKIAIQYAQLVNLAYQALLRATRITSSRPRSQRSI